MRRTHHQHHVDLPHQFAHGALATLLVETDNGDIGTDQARVRDNLHAVPTGTPLYTRLIDKLSAEETRLDALAQSIATAHDAIDKAIAALADYVSKLTL